MQQQYYIERYNRGVRYPEVIFNAGCKGSNFMTPDKMDYFSLGQWGAAELSKGTGMSNNTIWGVSVVIIDDGRPVHESALGSSFYSQSEAMQYINELQQFNNSESAMAGV